ncbi:MAG: accessory Sec system translocase SecA2 [Fuerstiella sp.]|nr:accessory Sec system translocase SecA2 [Fuerstiella sp.]
MKTMIASLIDFVQRLRHGVTLSNAKFDRLVDALNHHHDSVALLDDNQLRTRFDELRAAIDSSISLDDISINAFAIIREAARRSLSMRPYDVQMLAAFAMHDGKCVEMQTGEGKTLAAAVTVCLRALAGCGVHVLTFNDYLARRDATWMGPLYRFLGLSVGYVIQGMPRQDRQKAYNCDITYVTAKEAGFDFLRDHLSEHPEHRVQRGFHFAIADEADSILIDEGRTPLVIATEAEKDKADLYMIAERVRPLRPGLHYEIKSSGRNIAFTDSGIALLEQQAGILELHHEDNVDLLTRLNLALQAQVLLTRDVDYLVHDNSVKLIDEFTGRVAEDRRWPGGLQAALEAKEGLKIQPQGRILNSISLQHFLELYDKLAGMTGTAVEATEELEEFYQLKVVIIPPNESCVRVDHPDRIFATKAAKLAALVEELQSQHEQNRPVLIGTANVDESEELAQMLQTAGVPCRVLNAANDHLEAEIIAEAGALGAVTISTNMAGRGTDICLGGSEPETRNDVIELGGLYVIGTNRHESRRIDNQLRGRSGRQGDPGESRFFVSLRDDLISRHGIADLISPPSQDVDQPIDDKDTATRIGHVQRVIEGESFEIRRTLRMYSFLLELQRRTICQHREELLNGSKTPNALNKRDPESRERLVDKWGEQHIVEAERKVTLIHIDWCWSDHLTHASEIREGIHLVSLGGFNAFDTFNKEMNIEFRSLLSLIDQKVVETMTTAAITENGIDLQQEGLTGPSSTWTFMINDNPRGAVMNQIIRGVVDRLKSTLGRR